MKISHLQHRALAPIGALALVFLGAAPGTSVPAVRAATGQAPPPITWDAASIDTDLKTHVLVMKDVLITYGTMTVKADRAHATAMDFKDSHWTFDGNVRINAAPRGNLRSDEAVVEFQDNQLKRATATGNPAEFDQKRSDSDQVARGHASQIVYEVGAGTIRLSNDAWISDGHNDISGPLIVYSLREEHVQAFSSHDDRVDASVAPPSGNGETRVHVTIAPSEAPKLDGAATNKPQPTDSPPQPQQPAAQQPASPAAGTPAPQPTPTPR
jgi:lipopolysaccharide transport protein LptA